MKLGATLLCFVLFSMIHSSCQKEYSCENCIEVNIPPIADAGPDQIITLPTDSASLDGNSSSDVDGTITSYAWRKITGPASFLISAPTLAKTTVKKLTVGLYQVELKLTDDGGLIATDTMQIIVNDPAQLNQPPVAIAGNDKNITLPDNFASLDGSASYDPDNNIAAYAWTKISGPPSINISNADSSKTQITNLIEGVYMFELNVTDGEGLFSMDTVWVTVNTLHVQPQVENIEPNIVLTLPLDSVIIWGTFDAWWSPGFYNWTQISGPSVVDINVNPGFQLFARQLVQGTYSFQIKNNTIVDTINVLVINDQQDPNTITYKNLKWVFADEYGIGFTDLSLRFPPQPCLFIMPGYQLRPLEVYLQLDPASQWFMVPSVQSGAQYGYDSSSNGLWIMRLPVDNLWDTKKSSIKVKLL